MLHQPIAHNVCASRVMEREKSVARSITMSANIVFFQPVIQYSSTWTAVLIKTGYCSLAQPQLFTILPVFCKFCTLLRDQQRFNSHWRVNFSDIELIERIKDCCLIAQKEINTKFNNYCPSLLHYEITDTATEFGKVHKGQTTYLYSSICHCQFDQLTSAQVHVTNKGALNTDSRQTMSSHSFSLVR